MTTINKIDESVIDWDWYACDLHGQIGHFTSAGVRILPRTVRADRERVDELIKFFWDLNQSSAYMVREHAELDAGGWTSPAARERYLRSFIEAAGKGLFSYDTELTRDRSAGYHMVAEPKNPLTINNLSKEMQALLQITRAPLVFVDSPYISEAITLDW